MTKKFFVYIIVLSQILPACTTKNVGCEICGEFNVVNLSKNEINALEFEDVSVSRNLVIADYKGADYYTIWSWNENHPDSAWTESMQKEMYVSESSLVIGEDGTWSWMLNTEERFLSSAFYGNNNYIVNKDYKETGTWEYLNENRKFISMARETATVENRVVISDKNNPDHIISELPFSMKQNFKEEDSNRRFEVNKDERTGDLVLKSIEDDEKVALLGIHDASYSLTEGNVLVTLNDESKTEKLAIKSR